MIHIRLFTAGHKFGIKQEAHPVTFVAVSQGGGDAFVQPDSVAGIAEPWSSSSAITASRKVLRITLMTAGADWGTTASLPPANCGKGLGN